MTDPTNPFRSKLDGSKKKEVVIKSFFAAWILIRVCLYPLHGLAVISCRMCMSSCQRIGVGLWTSGLYTIVVEKPLVISWSIDNLFRCGWKHSSRISYHGSMLLDIHLLSHERRACKMFWPRAMMDEPWMHGMQNVLTMHHDGWAMNAGHAEYFDHAPCMESSITHYW